MGVESRERLRPKPYSSETLTRGKDIINRLVGTETTPGLIQQAKYSIDLQFYTFEADATGRKVLSALREAKAKNPNLQIRLLVDNSISMFHNSGVVSRNGEARKKRDETYDLLNTMQHDGILDVKVTNWFPQNPGINALHVYSNVIHRDHKKMVCVDARGEHPDASPQALITSANIAWYHENLRKEVGRVYHGDGPIPFLEKDFDYSFQHAQLWERVYSVRSVGEYFKKYGLRRGFWEHVGQDLVGSIVRNPQKSGERMVFKEGPRGYDSAVLTDSFYGRLPLLGNKLGSREATNELFTMLELAKPGETIITFTPYPGTISLTKAMIQAAQKGVHVQLIIAGSYEDEFINPKNLHGMTRILERHYGPWPKKLIQNGIDLYEYVGEKEDNKGRLHAKGALWLRSDGTVRTLIGSTNFSKNIISGLNREIAVVEESDTHDPLVAYAESLKDDSKKVVI